MVDLLDRLPGIVVLHDFYLEFSMLDYMDGQHARHPGLFKAELERSHGKKALSLWPNKAPPKR